MGLLSKVFRWTPETLMKAAEDGNLQTVRFLLARGVNPRTTGEPFEQTPLHRTAEKGHRDVAEVLLAVGADPNAKSRGSATALHLAALHGKKDVVKLLLERGADVNAQTKSQWTPLHQAAISGCPEVVDLLLANGADINAKADNDVTPLHAATKLASRPMHPQLVELLLSNDVGAKLDLMEAARVIRPELIELLDADSPIKRDLWDPREAPKILSEYRQREKKVVKLLLIRGAKRNECQAYGDPTPLHIASANGDTEVVETLLNFGADVEGAAADPDEAGTVVYHIRPLHLAVYHGQKEVVEILLDHGANINAFNGKLHTPLDVAAESVSGGKYRYRSDGSKWRYKLDHWVEMTNPGRSRDQILACQKEILRLLQSRGGKFWYYKDDRPFGLYFY